MTGFHRSSGQNKPPNSCPCTLGHEQRTPTVTFLPRRTDARCSEGPRRPCLFQQVAAWDRSRPGIPLGCITCPWHAGPLDTTSHTKVETVACWPPWSCDLPLPHPRARLAKLASGCGFWPRGRGGLQGSCPRGRWPGSLAHMGAPPKLSEASQARREPLAYSCPQGRPQVGRESPRPPAEQPWHHVRGATVEDTMRRGSASRSCGRYASRAAKPTGNNPTADGENGEIHGMFSSSDSKRTSCGDGRDRCSQGTSPSRSTRPRPQQPRHLPPSAPSPLASVLGPCQGPLRSSTSGRGLNTGPWSPRSWPRRPTPSP